MSYESVNLHNCSARRSRSAKDDSAKVHWRIDYVYDWAVVDVDSSILREEIVDFNSVFDYFRRQVDPGIYSRILRTTIVGLLFQMM